MVDEATYVLSDKKPLVSGSAGATIAPQSIGASTKKKSTIARPPLPSPTETVQSAEQTTTPQWKEKPRRSGLGSGLHAGEREAYQGKIEPEKQWFEYSHDNLEIDKDTGKYKLLPENIKSNKNLLSKQMEGIINGNHTPDNTSPLVSFLESLTKIPMEIARKIDPIGINFLENAYQSEYKNYLRDEAYLEPQSDDAVDSFGNSVGRFVRSTIFSPMHKWAKLSKHLSLSNEEPEIIKQIDQYNQRMSELDNMEMLAKYRPEGNLYERNAAEETVNYIDSILKGAGGKIVDNYLQKITGKRDASLTRGISRIIGQSINDNPFGTIDADYNFGANHVNFIDMFRDNGSQRMLMEALPIEINEQMNKAAAIGDKKGYQEAQAKMEMYNKNRNNWDAMLIDLGSDVAGITAEMMTTFKLMNNSWMKVTDGYLDTQRINSVMEVVSKQDVKKIVEMPFMQKKWMAFKNIFNNATPTGLGGRSVSQAFAETPIGHDLARDFVTFYTLGTLKGENGDDLVERLKGAAYSTAFTVTGNLFGRAAKRYAMMNKYLSNVTNKYNHLATFGDELRRTANTASILGNAFAAGPQGLVGAYMSGDPDFDKAFAREFMFAFALTLGGARTHIEQDKQLRSRINVLDKFNSGLMSNDAEVQFEFPTVAESPVQSAVQFRNVTPYQWLENSIKNNKDTDNAVNVRNTVALIDLAGVDKETKTLLDKIVADHGDKPITQESLTSVEEGNEIRAFGAYANGQFYMTSDPYFERGDIRNRENLLHFISHEGTHAITVDRYNSDPNFKADIDKMAQDVKNAIATDSKISDQVMSNEILMGQLDYAGLIAKDKPIDPYEFMAFMFDEGTTEFRDLLRTIKPDSKKSNSLLDKLANSLGKTLKDNVVKAASKRILYDEPLAFEQTAIAGENVPKSNQEEPHYMPVDNLKANDMPSNIKPEYKSFGQFKAPTNRAEGTPADKAMREVADGFIGEFNTMDASSSLTSMQHILEKRIVGQPVTMFSGKYETVGHVISTGPMIGSFGEGGNRTIELGIGVKGKNNKIYGYHPESVKDLYPYDIDYDNQINTDLTNAKIIMLARNREVEGDIHERTKQEINKANDQGSEFVVGNSWTDKPFHDYLNEIGAKYTIYGHEGSNRIAPDKTDVEQSAEKKAYTSEQMAKDVQDILNVDITKTESKDDKYKETNLENLNNTDKFQLYKLLGYESNNEMTAQFRGKTEDEARDFIEKRLIELNPEMDPGLAKQKAVKITTAYNNTDTYIPLEVSISKNSYGETIINTQEQTEPMSADGSKAPIRTGKLNILKPQVNRLLEDMTSSGNADLATILSGILSDKLSKVVSVKRTKKDTIENDHKLNDDEKKNIGIRSALLKAGMWAIPGSNYMFKSDVLAELAADKNKAIKFAQALHEFNFAKWLGSEATWQYKQPIAGKNTNAMRKFMDYIDYVKLYNFAIKGEKPTDGFWRKNISAEVVKKAGDLEILPAFQLIVQKMREYYRYRNVSGIDYFAPPIIHGQAKPQDALKLLDNAIYDTVNWIVNPAGTNRTEKLFESDKYDPGKFSDKYNSLAFNPAVMIYKNAKDLLPFIPEAFDDTGKPIQEMLDKYSLVYDEVNDKLQYNELCVPHAVFDKLMANPTLAKLFSTVFSDGISRVTNPELAKLFNKLVDADEDANITKGTAITTNGILYKSMFEHIPIDDYSKTFDPDVANFLETIQKKNIGVITVDTAYKNNQPYKAKEVVYDDITMLVNDAGMPVAAYKGDRSKVDSQTLEEVYLRLGENLAKGIVPSEFIAKRDLTGDSGIAWLSWSHSIESAANKAPSLQIHELPTLNSGMPFWHGETGEPAYNALRDAHNEMLNDWTSDMNKYYQAYQTVGKAEETLTNDDKDAFKFVLGKLRKYVSNYDEAREFQLLEMPFDKNKTLSLLDKYINTSITAKDIAFINTLFPQLFVGQYQAKSIGKDSLLAKLIAYDTEDLIAFRTNGCSAVYAPMNMAKSHIERGIAYEVSKYINKLNDNPEMSNAKIIEMAEQYELSLRARINEFAGEDKWNPETNLPADGNPVIFISQDIYDAFERQYARDGIGKFGIGSKLFQIRTPAADPGFMANSIVGGICPGKGTVMVHPSIATALQGMDGDKDNVGLRGKDNKYWTHERFNTIWDHFEQAGVTKGSYTIKNSADPVTVDAGGSVWAQSNNLTQAFDQPKPQHPDHTRDALKRNSGQDTVISLKNIVGNAFENQGVLLEDGSKVLNLRVKNKLVKMKLSPDKLDILSTVQQYAVDMWNHRTIDPEKAIIDMFVESINGAKPTADLLKALRYDITEQLRNTAAWGVQKLYTREGKQSLSTVGSIEEPSNNPRNTVRAKALGNITDIGKGFSTSDFTPLESAVKYGKIVKNWISNTVLPKAKENILELRPDLKDTINKIFYGRLGEQMGQLSNRLLVPKTKDVSGFFTEMSNFKPFGRGGEIEIYAGTLLRETILKTKPKNNNVMLYGRDNIKYKFNNGSIEFYRDNKLITSKRVEEIINPDGRLSISDTYKNDIYEILNSKEFFENYVYPNLTHNGRYDILSKGIVNVIKSITDNPIEQGLLYTGFMSDYNSAGHIARFNGNVEMADMTGYMEGGILFPGRRASQNYIDYLDKTKKLSNSKEYASNELMVNPMQAIVTARKNGIEPYYDKNTTLSDRIVDGMLNNATARTEQSEHRMAFTNLLFKDDNQNNIISGPSSIFKFGHAYAKKFLGKDLYTALNENPEEVMAMLRKKAKELTDKLVPKSKRAVITPEKFQAMVDELLDNATPGLLDIETLRSSTQFHGDIGRRATRLFMFAEIGKELEKIIAKPKYTGLYGKILQNTRRDLLPKPGESFLKAAAMLPFRLLLPNTSVIDFELYDKFSDQMRMYTRDHKILTIPVMQNGKAVDVQALTPMDLIDQALMVQRLVPYMPKHFVELWKPLEYLNNTKDILFNFIQEKVVGANGIFAEQSIPDTVSKKKKNAKLVTNKKNMPSILSAKILDIAAHMEDPIIQKAVAEMDFDVRFDGFQVGDMRAGFFDVGTDQKHDISNPNFHNEIAKICKERYGKDISDRQAKVVADIMRFKSLGLQVSNMVASMIHQLESFKNATDGESRKNQIQNSIDMLNEFNAKATSNNFNEFAELFAKRNLPDSYVRSMFDELFSKEDFEYGIVPEEIRPEYNMRKYRSLLKRGNKLFAPLKFSEKSEAENVRKGGGTSIFNRAYQMLKTSSVLDGTPDIQNMANWVNEKIQNYELDRPDDTAGIEFIQANPNVASNIIAHAMELYHTMETKTGLYYKICREAGYEGYDRPWNTLTGSEKKQLGNNAKYKVRSIVDNYFKQQEDADSFTTYQWLTGKPIAKPSTLLKSSDDIDKLIKVLKPELRYQKAPVGTYWDKENRATDIDMYAYKYDIGTLSENIRDVFTSAMINAESVAKQRYADNPDSNRWAQSIALKKFNEIGSNNLVYDKRWTKEELLNAHLNKQESIPSGTAAHVVYYDNNGNTKSIAAHVVGVTTGSMNRLTSEPFATEKQYEKQEVPFLVLSEIKDGKHQTYNIQLDNVVDVLAGHPIGAMKSLVDSRLRKHYNKYSEGLLKALGDTLRWEEVDGVKHVAVRVTTPEGDKLRAFSMAERAISKVKSDQPFEFADGLNKLSNKVNNDVTIWAEKFANATVKANTMMLYLGGVKLARVLTGGALLAAAIPLAAPSLGAAGGYLMASGIVGYGKKLIAYTLRNVLGTSAYSMAVPDVRGKNFITDSLSSYRSVMRELYSMVSHKNQSVGEATVQALMEGNESKTQISEASGDFTSKLGKSIKYAIWERFAITEGEKRLNQLEKLAFEYDDQIGGADMYKAIAEAYETIRKKRWITDPRRYMKSASNDLYITISKNKGVAQLASMPTGDYKKIVMGFWDMALQFASMNGLAQRGELQSAKWAYNKAHDRINRVLEARNNAINNYNTQYTHDIRTGKRFTPEQTVKTAYPKGVQSEIPVLSQFTEFEMQKAMVYKSIGNYSRTPVKNTPLAKLYDAFGKFSQESVLNQTSYMLAKKNMDNAIKEYISSDKKFMDFLEGYRRWGIPIADYILDEPSFWRQFTASAPIAVLKGAGKGLNALIAGLTMGMGMAFTKWAMRSTSGVNQSAQMIDPTDPEMDISDPGSQVLSSMMLAITGILRFFSTTVSEVENKQQVKNNLKSGLQDIRDITKGTGSGWGESAFVGKNLAYSLLWLKQEFEERGNPFYVPADISINTLQPRTDYEIQQYKTERKEKNKEAIEETMRDEMTQAILEQLFFLRPINYIASDTYNTYRTKVNKKDQEAIQEKITGKKSGKNPQSGSGGGGGGDGLGGGFGDNNLGGDLSGGF